MANQSSQEARETVRLSPESIILRMAEIEGQTISAREKREDLNKQVSELAKRRNTLNKEVQELIATAKAERESRDTKNKRIAELKEQREIELRKIEELRQKIDDQRSKIRESDETASRRGDPSARALEREIRDLDWRLQTTTLKLDEERAIVEQISHLEDLKRVEKLLLSK